MIDIKIYSANEIIAQDLITDWEIEHLLPNPKLTDNLREAGTTWINDHFCTVWEITNPSLKVSLLGFETSKRKKLRLACSEH